MSDATQTWQTTLHAILMHPRAPQVLMMPGADGWLLPQVTLAEDVWRADMRAVHAGFHQVIAAQFAVLRYIHYHTDYHPDYPTGPGTNRNEVVYVLENHDATWEPQGGAAWVGRADVAGLPLAHPDHRALIDKALAEMEGGQVPAIRPPWARPGWFGEAAAWTEAELLRLGYTLTAPVEQVKSWGISCILRAHTTAGLVYFKVASSLPLFAHEPLLMQRLAARYPACIPAPLSIDEPRRWMLLADFGPAVGWDAPVEALEEMLVSFAKLQRDAATRADDLAAMGCLDRSLDRLAAQIDPLLSDPEMLAAQANTDEMARLRALGPRLKAMCAELATYAVPHTLVHGDLHLGNVARSGDGFLFFDWTDACLAHPFLDTISIYQTEDPAVEARLRDAYLRVWTDFEPMDRLLEAWALAKPLLALHQAVSYQHIIATLEDVRKPENLSGLPYWLRKMLAMVEE